MYKVMLTTGKVVIYAPNMKLAEKKILIFALRAHSQYL